MDEKMVREMAAKFPGKCEFCGGKFPAGERIAFDGRASHVECFKAYAAKEAAEEAEKVAQQMQYMSDFKAGKCIRSRLVEYENYKELIVERCPSYEMAKAEAFAVAASIVAAGGEAAVLAHKRNGKRYVGRELISYYGGSNLGHHEGWAFRFKVSQLSKG